MELADLKNLRLCANRDDQMCFACFANCGEIHTFRSLFTEDTQENVDLFNEMKRIEREKEKGGKNG